MRRPRRPAALRLSATATLAGLLTVTVAAGATTVTAAVLGHRPHVRVTRVAAVAPVADPARTQTPAPISAPISRTAHQAIATPVLTVPRPKHLVTTSLLLTTDRPLRASQRHALHRLSGVARLERVSAGHTRLAGHHAFVLGVNPTTFRAWTPKLTAKSNALWSSIARGELTASFDMGHGAKLPLGQSVALKARRTTQVRIGAFASVGMSGVDAVVSQDRARQIGLRRDTGVVISAPKADILSLRKSALRVAGHHARAELLRQVIVTRDAGEFLTRQQITSFLHAAASRVGKPYVWGATGPNSFDCSGLVMWSFAKAGIRMPRVSEEQWLTGPHIAYKDARPGDLLFWHYDPTDPKNVDHVAIYAGNGMMLVAPHTGENVSYRPVPLADLAGVVRVDPALATQIA